MNANTDTVTVVLSDKEAWFLLSQLSVQSRNQSQGLFAAEQIMQKLMDARVASNSVE